MADSTLMDRLESLLEAPTDGADAPSLTHLETTLTDGYARALALEAERVRLARQISELAARDGGDAGEQTRELNSLSARLAKADGDLSRLRLVLGALRGRAKAARAATAAA